MDAGCRERQGDGAGCALWCQRRVGVISRRCGQGRRLPTLTLPHVSPGAWVRDVASALKASALVR